MNITPLMNDGFDGQPAKRVLQYMERHKDQGTPIVGIYCSYAPLELIQSMGIVPAVLCSFADAPITSAESVLPANLCPLIKSSYGFILEGTCPFFSMSDAIIAETTCDGKKKMFELAAEIKPLHVMDLPQLPDEPEALQNWTTMIRKLQRFLETTFQLETTDQKIEQAIKNGNKRNRKMREIYDFAAMHPPVISWEEMYDIGFLTLPSTADEVLPTLEKMLERLRERVEQGVHFGTLDSPRVLVSGCPVGGDALKIFKIIEDCGGLVVAPDSCTGMKTFMGDIEENSPDPIKAIAKRYLEIPCACMTPNDRRLELLSQTIEHFRPDVIVDFVLTACHSFNIEAYKVGRYVTEKHDLPYLKIESDYSDNDVGQIRTKIEALFEIIQ
ncbi:MAG: 2-hydroxyacyl-CoA dehydratase [Desulfocapsa sp.]|nr:2-hydroxyacyl-CoA dehydratase [Desulfocapsa sp.]MBN4045887.1 2-hydroxyacyl-CoA dehydratase [bacterium AH-315-P11]